MRGSVLLRTYSASAQMHGAQHEPGMDGVASNSAHTPQGGAQVLELAPRTASVPRARRSMALAAPGVVISDGISTP